jgi:hypothetical protein
MQATLLQHKAANNVHVFIDNWMGEKIQPRAHLRVTLLQHCFLKPGSPLPFMVKA